MAMLVFGQDSQLIERALKATGEERQRVQGRIPHLSDLLSTTTLDGNGLASNPCLPANAGCAHLCLLMDAGDRGRCACPLDLVLADDGAYLVGKIQRKTQSIFPFLSPP